MLVWSFSLYFSTLMSCFGLFKLWCGEDWQRVLADILFCLSWFSWRWCGTRPSAFVLLLFEFAECSAWFFTEKGLNIQAIQAVDLVWLVRHVWYVACALSLLICFSAVFVFLPVPAVTLSVHFPTALGIVSVGCLSLCFAVSDFVGKLDPLKCRGNELVFACELVRGVGRRDQIISFLAEQPEVGYTSVPSGKRNLILLEVESLEYAFIDGSSRTTMPSLSKRILGGTFFRNVFEQPYTDWSVAAMFASQCNLPLLMQTAVPNFQGSFHLYPNLKCLGDFLSLAGWDLYSYQTGFFVGGFKKQLSLHHYVCYDVNDHSATRDWDLFNLIGTTVLPNLTNSVRPWVLHIANTDTHPFPTFFIDERCERRRSGSAAEMAFDCLDQILEKFFEQFLTLNMSSTTEILLFGDHLLMAGMPSTLKRKRRATVIAFPLREQRCVSKPVSVYDIAPTVLSLLGVQYHPTFPFGRSLLSQDIGQPPDESDLRLVYEFYRAEMNWSPSVSCRPGDKGFCKRKTQAMGTR